MNQKFYGKYRGMVMDNVDHMQIGRLLVQVPDVGGLATSSWAMPCFPHTGLQMGFWALPQVGAGVWVEYEQGDPDFSKEGAFAEWQKSKVRAYWIGKYTIDKDSLVIDGGDCSAVDDLMRREKFAEIGQTQPRYFVTPPGWLAKYLEKFGPAAIFAGKDPLEYKRIP